MDNEIFRRPTLKDIAVATGYSVNTVSRALRNKSDISAATRERIRAVSGQMGYVNNTLASSLRLGYTKTLAVIIPDVSNLFFTFAMEEIERRAREHGYSTILLNTSENGEHELWAIKTALNKNVDGIVFSPAQSSLDTTNFLLSSGTPFVLYARYFRSIPSDYVVGDDVEGGYLATKHLLENGHRNILFINGISLYNSSAQGRETGYRRAHAEAGIPVREELIRESTIKGAEPSRVLEEALKTYPDITAVFAFNDMMALACYSYLVKRGLRVPEDISLVGFDNIQSKLEFPFPITSIDNNKQRMAAIALEALIEKLDQKGSHKIICQETLPVSLVDGGTVKRL